LIRVRNRILALGQVLSTSDKETSIMNRNLAVVQSQTSDALSTLTAIISERSTLMAQSQELAAQMQAARSIADGALPALDLSAAQQSRAAKLLAWFKGGLQDSVSLIEEDSAIQKAAAERRAAELAKGDKRQVQVVYLRPGKRRHVAANEANWPYVQLVALTRRERVDQDALDEMIKALDGRKKAVA
jgi:hypothetical protein